MALDELKGQELGEQTVVVERAPVPAFARAIGDDPEAYDTNGDPVPPTYPFSWAYWGTVGGELKGLPIGELRPRGMILHGEQEFTYHAQPTIGQTLIGTRRIADVYEKDTSS